VSLPANKHSENWYPAYRADIDGLRGVAVLCVLGYHASHALLPGGFVGVDIFFVISGYLISSIIFKGLQQGRFSFQDFYSRRIARIFPSLILLLAAVLAFGWHALIRDDYRQLAKHAAAGASFIANFADWRESGYFNSVADFKPLLHLWSLGVEEQFYIVWPITAYLIWRWRLKPLWVIWALVFLSFAANVIFIRTSVDSSFYLPITRFWELLAGATLAARAVLRGQDSRSISGDARQAARNNIQSAVGLILIFAVNATFNTNMAFPGWWAILPVAGAYLIVSSSPGCFINRRLLGNPVLVFVGLISYPLYLWHWPLFSFAQILTYGHPASWLKPSLTALAFVLAWLTYRIFERPIRTGRSGHPVLIPGSLVTVMTILLVVSLNGTLNEPVHASRQGEENQPRSGQTAAAVTARVEPTAAALAGDARDGTSPTQQAHARTNSEESSPNSAPAPTQPAATTKSLAEVKDVFLDAYGPNYERRFTSANRYGKCVDKADFDPECYSPPTSRSVLLWGDSHAAALYSGLKASITLDVSLLQMNFGGCPPLVHIQPANVPPCHNANLLVVDKMSHIRPDVVLMAGDWRAYVSTFGGVEGLLRELDASIDAARAAGARGIVLVGQLPAWGPELYKIVYQEYISKGLPPPEYSSTGLYGELRTMDDVFAAHFAQTDVKYVSPWASLCSDAGCRIFVGPDYTEDLLDWDYAHLTINASRFFAKRSIVPVLSGILN
jgi:peptidoglycan/LPS O-acetylase OafA/YrhL